MKFTKIAAIAGLALLGLSATASATTYTFNVTDVAAFGSAPYGTVDLVQDGSNVDITVTLNADWYFVMTGNLGSHALFAFNGADVALSDIVSISNGTASTFAAYAPATGSPFGDFDFGIQCTSCANGGNGKTPSPLTFTVNNALIADLVSLSSGGSIDAYFTADVITGRATGQIGVTGTPQVPEPASLALLGLGLAGLGLARRRRS